MNPHIYPFLDVSLSNIAQSKIHALPNFISRVARIARSDAADTWKFRLQAGVQDGLGTDTFA
jgi:hypothetical protein